MPDVVFTCACKCLFGRYIRDHQPWVADCPLCGAQVESTLPLNGANLKVSPLRLPGDQYDYISPQDGSHISSKRAHRDHLKRHNMIELGNEKPDLSKPLTPHIPREMLREEIKNNVERMKSHGTWRER